MNEKSLHGQFESVEEFLKSLSENLFCFQLVHEKAAGQIWKITDFYKCKITRDITLADLKKYPASDELRRFRIALEKVTENRPFWDDNPVHNYGEPYWCNGEDVSATAIAEASINESCLLSFLSEHYVDKILQIVHQSEVFCVHSIYTPNYLVQSCGDFIKLSRDEYLKIRYRGTRLDCSLLESKYGADELEKEEFECLMTTLDKFVKHESWESIDIDDGLQYKKYSPASGKEDWFSNSCYRDQQIMKFRFSGKMRCFGYRKKDYFRLLRIERDHKRSDKG